MVRLLLAICRAAGRGLRYVGAYTVGLSPERIECMHFESARDDETAAAPAGPPPGHPERVRPDLAPDELERLLWTQLRGPTDGSRR